MYKMYCRWYAGIMLLKIVAHSWECSGYFCAFSKTRRAKLCYNKLLVNYLWRRKHNELYRKPGIFGQPGQIWH